MSQSLLAAARKKTKLLEKELLRKNRALAETAALLTLSKKRRPSGVSTRKTDSCSDEIDGHHVDSPSRSCRC